MDKVEIIFDVATGKTTQIVRPYTEEELAYSQNINANISSEQASIQATIDAKASALAKLTALGLTADEVKALLGA